MRGSAFDEHEFHAERGPVLEELRRDHDDPWWRLHEALEATAYHVHPYRNPIIGWPEEVAKVPREDVLAFYDAWYRPNNCTVLIVGDVEPAHAEARVRALFGPIESRPLPADLVPQEPQQEGERRFELEMEVQVPRMAACFHTVRVRDPEDPVFDVLQTILATGKASRLYDRLVRRDRLVTEVGAWNDTRRDAGLFCFYVEMQDGASRADTEAALWEEVERLGEEGPNEEELSRARALLRAGHVYRQATAAGLADSLGTLHVLGGDWRLYETQRARIETVTGADIQDVVKRFLRRANRTVGWCLPRPADAPERDDLFEDDVHDIGEAPAAPDRPEPEILRREAAADRVVELPVHRVVLDNGLRVLLMSRRDVPAVAARLFVNAGHVRERVRGAASLAGRCLDEGAAGRKGEEISRFLDSRGARLSAGGGGAALQCLTRDARDGLDVMRDVILTPDFPAESVERKRGELLSQFRAENDDAAFTGRVRLWGEIYGEHPLGRRDKDSLEALHALKRDDLVAHHHACFVPGNAVLAIVGDFGIDEMEAEVRARFEGWDGRPADLPDLVDPGLGDPGEVMVAEDRDQLQLYLGHLGVRRDDPDFYPLCLGDYVLGAGPGFTDRLSHSLRDRQGLAYAVSAGITRYAGKLPGVFQAYMGTAPDLKDRALAGMREEIGRFVTDPILAEELENARRFLLGSSVFPYETAAGTAGQLVNMEWLGLGLDYPRRFVEAVRAVTVDQVEQAVRKHIRPDRLITVAVGRV